jgi:hypothetical protein
MEAHRTILFSEPHGTSWKHFLLPLNVIKRREKRILLCPIFKICVGSRLGWASTYAVTYIGATSFGLFAKANYFHIFLVLPGWKSTDRLNFKYDWWLQHQQFSCMVIFWAALRGREWIIGTKTDREKVYRFKLDRI